MPLEQTRGDQSQKYNDDEQNCELQPPRSFLTWRNSILYVTSYESDVAAQNSEPGRRHLKAARGLQYWARRLRSLRAELSEGASRCKRSRSRRDDISESDTSTSLLFFFFFFFFTQPGTWNPHFNRKLKLDSGPRWRWILKNVLKIRPASGKNVELMSCCHVSHETWVLIMCLPPRLWTQRSPLRSKPEGETHYENVSCCVVMQRVGPEPRHVALKKNKKIKNSAGIDTLIRSVGVWI